MWGLVDEIITQRLVAQCCVCCVRGEGRRGVRQSKGRQVRLGASLMGEIITRRARDY